MSIFNFLKTPNYRIYIQQAYSQLSQGSRVLALGSAKRFEEIILDLCEIVERDIEYMNENDIQTISEIYFYTLREASTYNQKQYVVANEMVSKYVRWIRSKHTAQRIIAYSLIKASHADFRLHNKYAEESIQSHIQQINQQMLTATTHKDKANVAYFLIPDEYEYLLFPKGIKQAETAIEGIASLKQIDLENIDANTYARILSMVVYVYNYDCNNVSSNDCTKLLANEFQEIPSKKTNWRMVYWYCHFTYNQNYFPLNTENCSLIHQSIGFSSLIETYSAEKCALMNPEYGLNPKYPLYTNGIPGLEYLNSFVSSDGEKLIWKLNRTYSLTIKPYRISTYEGYRNSGELHRIIYLSEDSNLLFKSKIPHGLKKL